MTSSKRNRWHLDRDSRLLQPVHQSPDHPLHLLRGAQLDGGGQGPLVLLLEGEGGGGLGLQVADVDDPSAPHQGPVVQGGAGPGHAAVEFLRPLAGQAHPGGQGDAQIALGQKAQPHQLPQQGIGPVGPGQPDQQGDHVAEEHRPGGAAIQREMLLQEGLGGEEKQLVPAGVPSVPGGVGVDQGGGPQPLGQVDLIPDGPVPDLLGAQLAAEQPGVEQLPEDGQAFLIPAAEGLHIPALQPLPVQLLPQLGQHRRQLRGVDGL